MPAPGIAPGTFSPLLSFLSRHSHQDILHSGTTQGGKSFHQTTRKQTKKTNSCPSLQLILFSLRSRFYLPQALVMLVWPVFLPILCISKILPILWSLAEMPPSPRSLPWSLADRDSDPLDSLHFIHTFPIQQQYMKHILCERNVPSYEGVKRPYNQGTPSKWGERQTIQQKLGINWVHPWEAVRGGGTKKDFEASIGVGRGRFLQAEAKHKQNPEIKR